MVIWITGISGAGKTTIANSLIDKYKKALPNLGKVLCKQINNNMPIQKEDFYD